ncbi:MAG: PTS sugar transporter subunit IIA [Propionibacteriales bacterium]|nr:PTS sugar transporter subunit IIA [Propionibacteriales bacterium]
MADQPSPGGLLEPRAIQLDAAAGGAEEAIRIAGQRLVDIGAVEPSYVDAMLERERSVSTVMGEGVAIPHGTNESKGAVLRNALSFIRFPDGVDWNGKHVEIAIGIAAQGNDHVGILSKLATILVDPDSAAELRSAIDPEQVVGLLAPDEGEDDS